VEGQIEGNISSRCKGREGLEEAAMDTEEGKGRYRHPKRGGTCQTTSELIKLGE